MLIIVMHLILSISNESLLSKVKWLEALLIMYFMWKLRNLKKKRKKPFICNKLIFGGNVEPQKFGIVPLLFPFSDCVIEWNVGGANFIVDLFSLSFGETVGVELEG